MKKLFLLLIFAVFSFAGFAQIKVLSPIEGTFANRQMLVIDTAAYDGTDSGDYYYSLNGSDPEAFGFAYDGPVLIDLDGPVELRIAKAGKEKQEITVKYTVIQDNAFSASYGPFISSFFDSGILNYTSGSIISIPPELKYSFGLPPDSFLTGRELSFSQDSILSRYIPCTVLDDASGKKWRFIVRTIPQSAGVYSRRDVPFVITDWNLITFTNQNYIYKIDSEYWSLPKESISLDRSVSHMIRWQNLEYVEGNPVEYFVLPPMPDLNQTTDEEGGIHFSINGDPSYSMSVLSASGSDYQELFTQLGADTFYGDSVSGVLDLGLFAGAVYQGQFQVPYVINKRPPSTPMITSTSTSFYSREPVLITITGEEMSDLYYAVSEPYTINLLTEAYTEDSDLFASIPAGEFKKADSSVIHLSLAPEGSGAVFFKVSCYSVNGSNSGLLAQYSVIIDQYNYYYNAFADSSYSDGTSIRPYADFQKCLEAVNKGRYACLRIKGPVKVPAGEHYILSNCEFVNEGDASFEFEPGAILHVKDSTVSFENFTIATEQKNETASYGSAGQGIIPFFKLDDSVLKFNGCQISTLFENDGLFIEAARSTVSINQTIASISAHSYASFVSGVKTNVDIQNSSINISSDTCVTVSLNGGDINLVNNSFKISGQKGRIAELFAVNGSLVSNSFKASLKSKNNAQPVYADKNSKVEQESNIIYGF